MAISIVVVTVTDVNDNVPTFLSSHYSSSVTEAAQSGHIVLSTITAFDLDEVKGRISLYSCFISIADISESLVSCQYYWSGNETSESCECWYFSNKGWLCVHVCVVGSVE